MCEWKWKEMRGRIDDKLRKERQGGEVEGKRRVAVGLWNLWILIKNKYS